MPQINSIVYYPMYDTILDELPIRMKMYKNSNNKVEKFLKIASELLSCFKCFFFSLKNWNGFFFFRSSQVHEACKIASLTRTNAQQNVKKPKWNVLIEVKKRNNMDELNRQFFLQENTRRCQNIHQEQSNQQNKIKLFFRFQCLLCEYLGAKKITKK